MEYIPFQLELKLELPNIVDNKEYTDFRKRLERIEKILLRSGIEELVIQSLVNSLNKLNNKGEGYDSDGNYDSRGK